MHSLNADHVFTQHSFTHFQCIKFAVWHLRVFLSPLQAVLTWIQHDAIIARLWQRNMHDRSDGTQVLHSLPVHPCDSAGWHLEMCLTVTGEWVDIWIHPIISLSKFICHRLRLPYNCYRLWWVSEKGGGCQKTCHSKHEPDRSIMKSSDSSCQGLTDLA